MMTSPFASWKPAERAAVWPKFRRSRTTFTSALDEIPGIGPVKRKALLRRFGSVRALQRATPQELDQVSELTKKDIEVLLEWMKQ